MTGHKQENGSSQFTEAYQVLSRVLANLEQMLNVFSHIFELEVAGQAKDVRDQMLGISDFYFWETGDGSGGWHSLDEGFTELEQKMGAFSDDIEQLDQSIGELDQIHRRFVLPQILVMLVSSLEVFLSTMFELGLSSRSNLDSRAIGEIRRGQSFQNWGRAVKAYSTFLGMDPCPEGVENSEVQALIQKRHVIVHQMGIVDGRALQDLRLPSTAVGKRLGIDRSAVIESLDLVGKIGKHVFDLSRQIYLRER